MKSLGLFDGPFLLQSPPNPGTFGPLRWWDASSFNDTLGDGSFITPNDPWEDLSSNHFDARSTLGHTPVFITNAINGRPVVRLQGAKRLVFEGPAIELLDFTILCVLVSAADSIFLSRDAANRQIRINRDNLNRASWFSGESGTEQISNLFTSNPSNGRMVGYRRQDTSLVTRSFRFFDNSNVVTPDPATIGSTSSFSFGPTQIGIIDGGPLNIDIAELAIYNKALTDSEIQILYAQYFKPKFALP